MQRFPLDMGKEASKAYRDANRRNESTLTYGEIEFWPFAEIFATIVNRYYGL